MNIEKLTLSSTGTVKTASNTRVLAALTLLREDIVSGVLKPGEKLRVQHLKSHYEVGAATLREALSLLVSESLVTATAQRGFNVAPISLEDLKDITETRILLEIRAACEAVKHGDENWEVNLVSAYHRLKNVEEKSAKLSENHSNLWEQRNTEFHEALVAACPSRWVRQFRDVLYTHSERYRRLSFQTEGISRDVHGEHREIFEAALERDVVKLTKHLTEHIEKTFEVVIKMVMKGQTQLE